MFTHIVVALDGSEFAESVLPYVEPLAAQFGSTLTLLRAIISPASIVAAEASVGGVPVVPSASPSEIAAAERTDAAAYLDEVVARLQQHGVKSGREVPEGAPAEAIIACARDLNADLIAMTTHGRGGLGRVVMGSVADAVLRGAPCPVLLIRVREPAPPEQARHA